MNRTQASEIATAPQLLRGRAISLVRAETTVLAAVLAVVFAVYVPTFNDYFHGDDFLAFVDLTTKPALVQVQEVFSFADSNVYWRPLGQVYYLAIYGAAGLDPYYFHLANLGVFLLTLALLYRFTVNFGLGRNVALGAVLLMGLLPNHVISVAWVTNAPRLMAVLFALVSLLSLQESIASGRRRFEVLAFIAMVLAVLSDEVALALTPLPFLYGLLAQTPTRLRQWQHVIRGLAYGTLGLSVTVLQFVVGTADHPAPAVVSLSHFGVGWHILREYWALTSKLVLPVQDGISLESISTLQWVAGAIAASLALAGVLAGSKRALFVIFWTMIALLPFTLWSTPIAPARYVYMAALPFSILLSWAIVSLLGNVTRSRSFGRLRRFGVANALAVVAVAGIAAVAAVSANETMARNEAFARTAEPYRNLAEGLPKVLSDVPNGSRLVIYYGVWEGSFVWQDAVVRTVFRDRTLKTVNVNRALTESSGILPQRRDIVVFHTERGFILPPQGLSRP